MTPFESPSDMQATWADISKAKRLFGWKPQTSPQEGFRKAVEWHVQNRKWVGTIKLLNHVRLED